MKRKSPATESAFLNRELSSLRFNARVIATAQNKALPLLERLRFLCIVSNNLDEFFEIRVAELKEKLLRNAYKVGPDKLSPKQTLAKISDMAHDMVSTIYHIFQNDLLPALAEQQICFLDQSEWSPALSTWLKNLFRQEFLPILSPIGLDYAHPFPKLVNKSLNFIISLEGKDAFGRDSGLAIVQAPRAIPRVYRVPDELTKSGENFVMLTSIIKDHAHELFPGMTVTGCYQFRLTRNSDLMLENDAVGDLAVSLQDKLLSRHYGRVARLEIDANCPAALAEFLLQKHHLTEADLYRCNGPVNLQRYMTILNLIEHPKLRYPNLHPQLPASLSNRADMFDVIRAKDVLLHHPYQSFNPVLSLIRQASTDPNVLAIKQTLYRTGHDSPVVEALIQAARAGKEVTVIIEIRARFDEESNITLANHLQEAGALVVYGIIGFKTHAKMALIVRREQGKLRRYAHLGTGNYQEQTAKVYTDLGLMTYDEDITRDVQSVFQMLTGMGKATKLQKIIASPFTLNKTMMNLISKEMQAAKAGKKAHLILKLNGLSDPGIIQKLYEASQVGVKIDLIVRGICCLRPGVKGLSERIRVRSIVGRFLEHERIYYFYHGGAEKLFCSSADMMERNLHYRVEVCFPIEDKQIAKRIKEECLNYYLKDRQNAWQLEPDGNYRSLAKKGGFCAQSALLAHYDN